MFFPIKDTEPLLTIDQNFILPPVDFFCNSGDLKIANLAMLWTNLFAL